MIIKLDHINMTVRNIQESTNWYQRLFGLSYLEGGLDDRGRPWAIIGKDDSMLCLYQDEDLGPVEERTKVTPYHRLYHFGIRVSDRDAWEKAVQENKLKVKYGGAYHYPRSVSWYITDPSGHEIEVSYTNNEPLRFD